MQIEELKKSVADEYAKQIVKRGSNPQMLSIEEGVMEVIWDSKTFTAAVTTDDGPKSLAGHVFQHRNQGDVQSGAVEPWKVGVDQLDAAIRHAFSNSDTVEALKEIQAIWDAVEKTCELAAARSRILLGRLAPLPMKDVPDWFEKQGHQISSENEEGEVKVNPNALASTKLLLSAMTASFDHLPVATIDVGPLGRIILDWHVDVRLRWMIDAVDAPWPVIKLYEVCSRSIGERPKSRIIYDAYAAIKSFADLTTN